MNEENAQIGEEWWTDDQKDVVQDFSSVWIKKRFEAVAGIWQPMNGGRMLRKLQKKAKKYPTVTYSMRKLGIMNIARSAGEKYQNMPLINMKGILMGKIGCALIATRQIHQMKAIKISVLHILFLFLFILSGYSKGISATTFKIYSGDCRLNPPHVLMGSDTIWIYRGETLVKMITSSLSRFVSEPLVVENVTPGPYQVFFVNLFGQKANKQITIPDTTEFSYRICPDELMDIRLIAWLC